MSIIVGYTFEKLVGCMISLNRLSLMTKGNPSLPEKFGCASNKNISIYGKNSYTLFVNSMFCEVMFNINYEIPVYGKDFVNWDYKKLYIESL